ncbi:MAG TPA: TonB-dependent receptor [Steroidobacteraceae bacterium]|nr:TonB-dependent receptor [Steroidobacteraceae bacterium]
MASPLVIIAGTALAQASAPSSPNTAQTNSSAAPSSGSNQGTAGASGAGDASDDSGVATVVVTARRLNAARSQIETETGASTYTIDSSAIAAEPGGQNVELNQVLLQAPDVAQDSFGQLHVRGDHNDLQYRLNGIILPEGISVFSQTLDPRLISSMSLITGALPAEYGLRTAGIIDITTNSGVLVPGGYVSFYGGSHGEIEPAAEVAGSADGFSYWVSGDMMKNDLGIESPDGSPNPVHDFTDQMHGFAYLEDILDPNDRVALIMGSSDESFQIPNAHGLQPPGVGGITGLGPCGTGTGFYAPPCTGTDTQVLQANGQYAYLSNDLSETQHELTQYAIGTWQRSEGAFNIESSVSARYTSLHFAPDWVGDLLYNGIAQNAFKDDTALAWQTDSSYQLNDAHTVRAGFYLQHDSSTSDTTSGVLPIDAAGFQTSDIPEYIIENGQQSQEIESVYLQDEWKILAPLTLNYGLRGDHYSAYSNGGQVSPRVNFVWQALPDTTVHGGYSRYFTPPPFELIASTTFTRFSGTTAVPPGTETQDTPPIAERSDYYDFGAQQKLLDRALTLGVDAYGETSQNLIDEGQFGAPIILTPFNYRWGRIGGIEFSENYAISNFSLYSNLAFQSAKGKGVESAQFNFTQAQLAYIADNYIHLDHEERVIASAGASYLWEGTRFSVDSIFGTGLREDLALPPSTTYPDGFDVPNGAHTGSYTVVNLGVTHEFALGGSQNLTLRFDVINLLDKEYFIRSGTGIGVFAAQYGASRGFFGGVMWGF